MIRSHMKVFELAKELDTKALDLIEKIKPLNFSIKNHMSELSDEQVLKIKEFVNPSAAVAAPVASQTVVKRKKAAAKSDDKAPVRSSVVIKRRKESEELSSKVDEELKVEEILQEEAHVVSTEETSAENEGLHTMPQDQVPGETVELVAETKEVTAKAAAPEVAQQPKARRFSFIKVADASSEDLAIRRPVIIEDVVSEEVKKEYEDVKARKQDDDDDHVSVERSAAEILRELEKDEAQGRKKGGFSFRDTTLVNEFRSTDYLRRERVYAPNKKKRLVFNRSSSKVATVAPSARKRVVDYRGEMSVEELAEALSLKVRQIAMKLDALGVERPDEAETFADWILDYETVQLIAAEFGYAAKDETVSEEQLVEVQDDAFELSSRPPVVTIMGHVDHGKTSLLDFIRRSRVVAKEAGGITQHIGAYTVKVSDAIQNIAASLVAAESGDAKPAKAGKAGKGAKASKADKGDKKSQAAAIIPEITFLDTPGHAAFSSMRSRGAQVTDIVILVVAASEGLMPQTREAIDHAKAAGVPLIVAVNKMDLPDANPDKVLQQLSELGIVSEEWGGDTQIAKISAKTGMGIDDLLEKIQLQAEMLELKARREGPANGTIIEAHLDKGRGSVATVLVNEGTLKISDYVVVGVQASKVRALIDDQGKNVREAGPSMPVMLLGLTEVPEAGDPLNVVEDEKKAKELIELRKRQREEQKSGPKMSMEELMRRMNEGEILEMPIILKGDVKGSVEAISGALQKLPTNKVRLKILSTAVGGISESDIVLASASKAIVIGFNVRPDVKALSEAERLGVQVKCYNIIYNLIDEIVMLMEGMLAPTVKEETLGQAEVRNVFNLSKFGMIAGSFVLSGKIVRSGQVRVLRQGRIVYTGNISGLKRFKDDAREVAQGYECGISIENFNDIKEGDILECFKQTEVATKLEGASA
jgi:translation initiation factor IF-2